MLIVKIELWSARTGEVSEIGRTYIANTGGGCPTRGDYRAWVCRRGGSIDPHEVCTHEDGGKYARRGEVKNYPRLSYNVWRLVIRALRSCFPEEK